MLEGKVALVTGGATGIGLGIGRVLAAKGARLVIAQLGLAGIGTPAIDGEVLTVETDVTDRASVDAAVAAAIARFGRLDLLVNNAAMTGVSAACSFLDSSPQHIEQVIAVNLTGVFHCSQAAALHMRAAGVPGSIVHISSVGAFAAQENASVYCATKAALVSLAQSMALELAPYGIRVNSIAPGDIRTATSDNTIRKRGAPGRYTRVTPLGRQGTPEDIGNAVAFLASDESAFITGATLTVDGGFLCY